MMVLPSSLVFNSILPLSRSPSHGVKDDGGVFDGLAIGVTQDGDFDACSGRRSLVFAAALLSVLSMKRKQAEGQAEGGEECGESEQGTAKHADHSIALYSSGANWVDAALIPPMVLRPPIVGGGWRAGLEQDRAAKDADGFT